MPYADVRGQHLWFEDVGAGTPLVLLHGFGGTARRDLGDQIAFFSQQFRVIAPDLRGYGRSHPKPRLFGADFYLQDALDVGALLDDLVIEQAHVLGYSDGGETALLMGIERPDRVSTIVAWGVCGSLGPEITHMAEGYLPASDWAIRRPERWQAMVADQGATWVQSIIEGWVAAVHKIAATGGDLSVGLAHEIECPVLLVNGESDEGNPPYLARQLADRIPGCTFEIWPERGHAVHREVPENFHRRILTFMQESSRAI